MFQPDLWGTYLNADAFYTEQFSSLVYSTISLSID